MDRRPNFVFILADDLGHADLGCYGARADTSPNLDRMASQGLRFTDAYSNSPVCSPTRFALATGRWQYRLRGAAEEPIAGPNARRADIGMPPDHPTLPSLLRDAGWHTALVGKWHLGHPPRFSPLKSGYAEHFGPMGGAVDYFTHTDMSGERDLWENDIPSQARGYLTDILSERAAGVIRRCSAEQRPFMVSLHYTAPHWPWETREDAALAETLRGRITHLDGGSIDTYRRMVRQMDEGIGLVLRTLEECGVADDTIVVFTSDNGGERFSDNWPLVGGKMDLTEGGIRVPLVVRWPRVVPPGGTTAQPAVTMDWMPTLLEAAGVAAHPDHPSDGISLVPVLRDPAASIERTLYWRMNHRGQRALRRGAWKYLRVDAHEYLFDLAADARERANLAAREPERFASMRRDWEAWAATMPGIPQDASVTLVYREHDMPQR